MAKLWSSCIEVALDSGIWPFWAFLSSLGYERTNGRWVSSTWVPVKKPGLLCSLQTNTSIWGTGSKPSLAGNLFLKIGLLRPAKIQNLWGECFFLPRKKRSSRKPLPLSHPTEPKATWAAGIPSPGAKGLHGSKDDSQVVGVFHLS